jgi:hypothetical protein
LLEPVPRDNMVVLPLRWEASGASGRLFPVLDANLVLTPGGEGAATLTLTGAYRPPPGSLGEVPDRALLNRAAAATVRSLVARVAASMVAADTAELAADGVPLPSLRWQAGPEVT